jgi:site-specific DNA recombinase
MRVCLYLRISTDEDHQPTSLRTQRERLERYCQAMDDWRVVHAFDDQASGATLDRPGLQQALELARERRFDLLLVYRVDRLSRKVRQLAVLCEELDQLDVVLKSATEPFDTGSPAGRMMLQTLGVFAEFEHATIVDRVTAGLERRVREGKWMSGRHPYGYKRDKETKALLPCPVRAPVVRRIFRLYAEGKLGTTAIARKLEAEGAPAPRSQGWSPNALQLILANPAYRGLIRWNDNLYDGLHEPLVDEETFERAQTILARRFEDAGLRRGNLRLPALRPRPLRKLRARLRRHERPRQRRPLRLLRLLHPLQVRAVEVRRRPTAEGAARGSRARAARRHLPRRRADRAGARARKRARGERAAPARGAAPFSPRRDRPP